MNDQELTAFLRRFRPGIQPTPLRLESAPSGQLAQRTPLPPIPSPSLAANAIDNMVRPVIASTVQSTPSFPVPMLPTFQSTSDPLRASPLETLPGVPQMVYRDGAFRPAVEEAGPIVPSLLWPFDEMGDMSGEVLIEPDLNAKKPGRTVIGPGIRFSINYTGEVVEGCRYGLMDTIQSSFHWIELHNGKLGPEPHSYDLVPESGRAGAAPRQGPYGIDNTPKLRQAKDPWYEGQQQSAGTYSKVDYPGRNEGFYRNSARDVLDAHPDIQELRLIQHFDLECWFVEECGGVYTPKNYISLSFEIVSDWSRAGATVNQDSYPAVVNCSGGASGRARDADKERFLKALKSYL